MANNIVGKRAGMLVAKKILKGSRIICLCDCGEKRTVNIGHFNTGAIKSCGCHVSRHGKRGTRAYVSWSNMIQRCRNKNNKRYKDYGSKGITVCDRWLNFQSFYEDMGECPDELQIDRIDNEKGYSPENCRWTTRKENMSNKKRSRRYHVYGEIFKTALDAAKKHKVSPNTILAWCCGRDCKNRKGDTVHYSRKEGCWCTDVY